jgi:TRAP-type mannitol/chloroaromatic compound transport system permease large subunit
MPIAPILIIFAMQVVVLILGCFMEVISIMMITLPIFTPLVAPLGFDPVWFLAIFLVNIATASNTPPFGMSLFVMKGVAPKDTTMGDIYRAAIPMVLLYIIAMAIMLAFPRITLWLPSVSSG